MRSGSVVLRWWSIAEFESWERLAEVCATYLGKGTSVAVEGRLQTRQWDDDRGARHWKTEVVASTVEMLSGRRKRDLGAESLAAQAGATGGDASADAEEAGDAAAEPMAEDADSTVLVA